MIINKEINRKFQKEFFFVRGKIDIDTEYFINKIKDSFNSNNNLINKTGVINLMTPIDYFIRDPKLHSIIREIAQHVDEYYNSKKTYLAASWGFEVRPGEKTNFHDHHEAIYSGVLYLNTCNHALFFPEINEYVMAEQGTFAVWNSFLVHGTKNNQDSISKIGISFNLNEYKEWVEDPLQSAILPIK
tara:strand:- start:347 stop:907 length:561 start_codon:yes stop_codon:yes gene_type:complete